jgi:hypothetical protein
MTEDLSMIDILDELEKNGRQAKHERDAIVTNKRQLIWIPLFWGSLWGLAEATLGHVLHHIPIPGIAGYVMFPIGVFFMVQALNHSGKLSAIHLTALVAAQIKLLDLVLPARSPFAVINPAVAILCESFVLGLFLRFSYPRKILGREKSSFFTYLHTHPALNTIPLVVAAIAVQLFLF